MCQRDKCADTYTYAPAIDLDGGTHELYFPDWDIATDVILDVYDDDIYAHFRNGYSINTSYGYPEAIHFKDVTLTKAELMALDGADVFNKVWDYYAPEFNKAFQRSLRW